MGEEKVNLSKPSTLSDRFVFRMWVEQEIRRHCDIR
jgi:hypothetical protein